MYKVLFLVFLGVLALREGLGDTSMGSCPDIEPVPDFDMTKILGYWYAIQKTSTSTPCLGYNITEEKYYPGPYKFLEIRQHQTLWSSGLHHQHFTDGHLSIPDPSVPGKMNMKILLDAMTTKFTVFMTDYDNYLAIFMCKELPLVHNWSALILSRTPNLDMIFVDKIRTRLSSYNVDPFTFKTISHEGCPKPGTFGTVIVAAADALAKEHNMTSGLSST